MSDNDVQAQIDDFLSGDVYAVAGASADRSKYGNKVLRVYLQNDKRAHPVNLRGGVIEGIPALTTLADLPEPVHGLSIITPPDQTERVVADAVVAGIPRIWMQPGAESVAAVAACAKAGIPCIFGGPCILVALHYRES